MTATQKTRKAIALSAVGVAMIVAAFAVAILLANTALVVGIIASIPLAFFGVTFTMIPWHMWSMDREGLVEWV